MKDGGIMYLDFVFPQRALPMILKHSPGFRRELKAALPEHPSSFSGPWRCICYAGEVPPGNLLRPDNRRNIVCVYWSHADLGKFLRGEASW